MPRDTQIGLALAILLIGVVGALMLKRDNDSVQHADEAVSPIQDSRSHPERPPQSDGAPRRARSRTTDPGADPQITDQPDPSVPAPRTRRITSAIRPTFRSQISTADRIASQSSDLPTTPVLPLPSLNPPPPTATSAPTRPALPTAASARPTDPTHRLRGSLPAHPASPSSLPSAFDTPARPTPTASKEVPPPAGRQPGNPESDEDRDRAPTPVRFRPARHPFRRPSGVQRG